MSDMKALQLLDDPKTAGLFRVLYGDEPETLAHHTGRYRQLVDKHRQIFSDDDVQLFSAPGRVEIGGNHTDHNAGQVLTASVDLDSIAAASASDDEHVTLYSEGYSDPFRVDLRSLEPDRTDDGTTALLKGIIKGLRDRGHRAGGMHICMSSDVLGGSGLSSSASLEMLIGTVLNAFYNDGQLDTLTLAQVGQYAENVYWNKPSGLLDQLACGLGGMVAIDFADARRPAIDHIAFDFHAQGYSLLVVNTGGSHGDLTEEYAAIPVEMRRVAAQLGGQVLREFSLQDVLNNIEDLRAHAGDRAVLRAMHYYAENHRVDQEVESLQQGDIGAFFELIKQSGTSSWKLLQNTYVATDPLHQSIPLALALTEHYLQAAGKGACRVHGGGFAGVILVFLANEHLSDYTRFMEQTFGPQSVTRLHVRPLGAIHLNAFP